MLKSFLFKAMDQNNIEILIDAMEAFNFKEGEDIIKQNDEGNTLYLLESGEASCYLRRRSFVTFY